MSEVWQKGVSLLETAARQEEKIKRQTSPISHGHEECSSWICADTGTTDRETTALPRLSIFPKPLEWTAPSQTQESALPLPSFAPSSREIVEWWSWVLRGLIFPLTSLMPGFGKAPVCNYVVSYDNQILCHDSVCINWVPHFNSITEKNYKLLLLDQ